VSPIDHQAPLSQGDAKVEVHPFEPFLPSGARLLMLGTFPPAPHRWSVPFFYPNFQNDMWRIVGLCFFGDKNFFVEESERRYRLDRLVPFLRSHGIALYDTCTRIVRTKNTASDKDLEVVEETNLKPMLHALPQCVAVVTAGQLATTLCCRQLGVQEPRVGEYVTLHFEGRQVRIYRMPSSSRAYPMAVERKAVFYQQVFDFIAHPTS